MHCTIFVHFVPFVHLYCLFKQTNLPNKQMWIIEKEGAQVKSHPSVHERRPLATAWLSKPQSQLLTPHIPGNSTLVLMPLFPLWFFHLGCFSVVMCMVLAMSALQVFNCSSLDYCLGLGSINSYVCGLGSVNYGSRKMSK